MIDFAPFFLRVWLNICIVWLNSTSWSKICFHLNAFIYNSLWWVKSDRSSSSTLCVKMKAVFTTKVCFRTKLWNCFLKLVCFGHRKLSFMRSVYQQLMWLIISTRLTWRGSSSWFRNCSSKRIRVALLLNSDRVPAAELYRKRVWVRKTPLVFLTCCWSEVQTACALQALTLSVHSGNLELSIGVNVLSEAVRCFPGAGLVHAADYFIHILNTHIFRKHSTSDSRDPFFTDCSFPFIGLNL